MKTLYETLLSYANSDYYGFHMPGHKRNKNLMPGFPCEMDITEIEGFDDLHHAEGILKEMQERAAQVYHAEETHFLVNGSTAGILAAIMGSVRRGEKIVVARNCHKSVYHAIEMQGLVPVYLYPDFEEEWDINGQIRAESVKELLFENPEVRAVVITSPTYEGMISNIRKIADIVHEFQIPLIVDAAHGAHFGFHPYFPAHANAEEADLVINSLHKTLPALTQTALLHINGKYADREEILKYLHMLQTSSPSYILMASMDACVSQLQNFGEELFSEYVRQLKGVREQLRNLRNLAFVETDDPSKIVISVKEIEWSGKKLYEVLLEEYHLQMEMAAGSYVLAMTSVGDTEEGMKRLADALFEIDGKIQKRKNQKIPFRMPYLEQVYTSSETAKRAGRKNGKNRENIMSLQWEQCEGHISTEYVYLYPPGIPLSVPGERISSEMIEQMLLYKKDGFQINGPKKDGEIEVLNDV